MIGSISGSGPGNRVTSTHAFPGGYALSFQTFTRGLWAALVVLLRKGIRLAWIRGVLLVVSSSYELSIQHTGELMKCLEYVGFTINLRGSSPWPTSQATFLGLLLDTESGRVTLSEESWADLGSSLAPFSPRGGARDLPLRSQCLWTCGEWRIR